LKEGVRDFFEYLPLQIELLALSANVGYTPHEGNVTCSRCGALYRQNH